MLGNYGVEYGAVTIIDVPSGGVLAAAGSSRASLSKVGRWRLRRATRAPRCSRSSPAQACLSSPALTPVRASPTAAGDAG